MCNAHNHDPGCSCGFGPPYTDVVYVGAAREWPQEVVDEPWLLRQGLEDLNYNEAAIQQFIQTYSDLTRAGAPRNVVASAIKDLLRQRETIEEEVWEETIKVPLYRFAAPGVKGATVTYAENESVREEAGWKLKVFGMGTGDTRDLEVSRNHLFVAVRSECKQVYVPIKFRVARVTIKEGGSVVSTGIRGEVPAPRKKSELSLHGRGCETLSRQHCRRQPPQDVDDVVEYYSKGDASGSHYETEWSLKTSSSNEMSLHLKKILEVGPFVRVTRTRRLTLKFHLPSGHDYRALVSCVQVWWEIPA